MNSTNTKNRSKVAVGIVEMFPLAGKSDRKRWTVYVSESDFKTRPEMLEILLPSHCRNE